MRVAVLYHWPHVLPKAPELHWDGVLSLGDRSRDAEMSATLASSGKWALRNAGRLDAEMLSRVYGA